jgi:A/G-specific adenine glycosylase
MTASPHSSTSPTTPQAAAPAHAETIVDRVVDWYAGYARDLPWRRDEATPWGVMVSEFMLQQTPVVRVLPVWEQWLATWPTPADLAAATSGDAVRAWGRLGYPRRAQRLHAAATAIVTDHGGQVPDSYDDLRALPGVGDYTAAAVATFGFGRRHVVLDTNVRRVLARTLSGTEFPAASVTRAERDLAAAVLPEDEATAATWSVASMELGALVCTAAGPRCGGCPVADLCAWRSAGHPAYDGPPRRGQTYAGTDRQCRGRLLAVLREAHEPVHVSRLEAVWSPAEQRDRALASLLEDGLVTEVSPGVFTL